MIRSKKSLLDSMRALGHGVVLAIVAVVLPACSMLQPQEPQVASYEYKSDPGFVRIEYIEPGTIENAHPFTVSANGLRELLGKLKVKSGPLFTPEELTDITPHLASALAKANPKQDVTFASIGKHGLFGKISPSSATTGRLFVQNGQLNLVLGVVHEPYDNEYGSVATKALLPGSRAKRIETGWKIDPTSARLADNRPDWVMFDVKATSAAGSATPSTTGAPNTDSRYQEIDNKLKLLDQLKQNGRITEEEYKSQRRAILQGI